MTGARCPCISVCASCRRISCLARSPPSPRSLGAGPLLGLVRSASGGRAAHADSGDACHHRWASCSFSLQTGSVSSSPSAPTPSALTSSVGSFRGSQTGSGAAVRSRCEGRALPCSLFSVPETSPCLLMASVAEASSGSRALMALDVHGASPVLVEVVCGEVSSHPTLRSPAQQRPPFLEGM